MNITIIRVKDLIKYLVEIAIIITVIAISTSFFNKQKEKPKENTFSKTIQTIADKFKENGFTSIFESTLPILRKDNQDNKQEKSLQEEILGVNFKMANYTNVNEQIEENIDDKQEEIKPQEEENTEEISLAKTDVTTKVIEENNIAPSYTDVKEDIQIKNQSSYPITDDLFANDYAFTDAQDILIFHTHTCESYTPTPNYNYQMTGNYRTTDLNYSVARVGEELKNQLTSYGYNVIHDTNYHDYPAYNGSYDRSEATVKNILAQNPNMQTIIDLHRDAVGSSNEYAPSVLIGEETAAQMMLVIGTDGGGLYHPNWRQNFKLAVMIQKKANELYPGLFRPIILRDSRYNQHLSSGAMIIEVGATGNTMEQCLVSMKYLAKIMSEIIK